MPNTYPHIRVFRPLDTEVAEHVEAFTSKYRKLFCGPVRSKKSSIGLTVIRSTEFRSIIIARRSLVDDLETLLDQPSLRGHRQEAEDNPVPLVNNLGPHTDIREVLGSVNELPLSTLKSIAQQLEYRLGESPPVDIGPAILDSIFKTQHHPNKAVKKLLVGIPARFKYETLERERSRIFRLLGRLATGITMDIELEQNPVPPHVSIGQVNPYKLSRVTELWDRSNPPKETILHPPMVQVVLNNH